MKSIYILLIALASILLGFALGRFIPSSAAHNVEGGFSSMSFNPATSVLRLEMCSPKITNDYYTFVLGYNSDSVTIGLVDTVNAEYTQRVTGGGTKYTLTCLNGAIDSIPISTVVENKYMLTDSTIYSRYGIIYGLDQKGMLQSFSIGDVIFVQGGEGTVTFGVINMETVAAKRDH